MNTQILNTQHYNINLFLNLYSNIPEDTLKLDEFCQASTQHCCIGIAGSRRFRSIRLLKAYLDPIVNLFQSRHIEVSFCVGFAARFDQNVSSLARTYSIDLKRLDIPFSEMRCDGSKCICRKRNLDSDKNDVIVVESENNSSYQTLKKIHTQMIERCDKMIIFWDQESTGTQQLIDYIKQNYPSKEVIMFNITHEDCTQNTRRYSK